MKKLNLFLATLCLAATTTHAQTNLWQNSGNIGIGTTNPGNKLTIIDGPVTLTGNTNAIWNAASYYSIDTVGRTFAFGSRSGAFSISDETAGAMRFLINSVGNVGIGTVAPQTPLHVIGPITAGYNASTWGEDYLYGAYGDGKLFVVGSKYSSGASFLGFAVKAKHLAVGYVSSTGITIPRAAIEASGEGVTILTGPSQTSSDGGPVNIAERVRIDAVGNVGIGTTSPERLLHVRGANGVVRIDRNSSAPGTMIARFSPDWSTVYKCFQIYVDGDGADSGCFGIGDSHQQIGGGADIRFYINNIGNVGIGTTSPTEKLSVNGKIRAKEVIVDTGWSDYVFKPDYRLASLSEVEGAIKRDGHLPGVPSAKEVSEKGVSVGDMQAILLAKIEEITLHQIAQEKELSALRAELTTLKAENTQLKAQTK